MAAVIQAQGLRKAYGSFEAVKGIDFKVEAGTCTGLLGPNGAGKTTTMRMLLGLATITGGDLTVFDAPAQSIDRATKKRTGLVPQEDNLDPDLTVKQNLEVYGRYFGLPREVINQRVPELLDFMQIAEKGPQRVAALSGGMKRRLVIARALINDPELIILDEPTTGLDPQARVMIWQKLQELKKRGKTLLLTTHYMDEAQRLCDHIVVIDGGEILDEGTPSQLIDRHVKPHVFEIVKPLPDGIGQANLEMEDLGDSALFFVETRKQIADFLGDNVHYLHRLANLEDVFLRLTGRKLRE